MNVFLLYVFLFFIGSTFGWVLELFYRRFKPGNIERKWVNPGFLNGPYLPIYGFGLCALYTISLVDGLFAFQSDLVHVLVLFFGIGALMTLIELIGGEIFIIGFKVKLWDYSKRLLNYKGIICPLFFFIWAALGTAYYFLVNPYIIEAIYWFTEHLDFSFVLGMFFGVFLIDVVYSCQLVVKIRSFAKRNGLLVKYEEFKETVAVVKTKYRERNRFFLGLAAASLRIDESFEKYKERVKECGARFMESRKELKESKKDVLRVIKTDKDGKADSETSNSENVES